MKIRILARVVIYNKGKILLVRNKGESFWYPPGGQWEYEKENIIEAARREVEEEVGLKVNIEKLLYLQEFRPKKDLKIFPKRLKNTFWNLINYFLILWVKFYNWYNFIGTSYKNC
ncbi:MAG: NUDIX domain-containing protein [Patescibacteria group bacterium]